MELTSSSHRTLAGNSANICYTIGEIFATLFAYVGRHWLNLKWFNSGYQALLLFYLYFIPESSFWFFSRRKFDQLEASLRKVATTNGRTDTEWLPYYKKLIDDPQTITEHTKSTIKDIILRFGLRFFISGLIAAVTMLLYIKATYGLALMNSTISPYVSVILGAIVESIGYVSATYMMTTRLGRKYSFMVYSLFTAGCVITTPFITDNYPVPTIVVSQLGKLAISGAVCISWIYVPELFPTSMRGLSNGVFVLFGRIGAILAPIIDATLGDRYMKITFYVYAALTVVIIVPVMILPETRDISFEHQHGGNLDRALVKIINKSNRIDPVKADIQEAI